jgi:hypothetical protein
MYAKIFRQIYEGTLCTTGPWQALVTFQQLLILADPDGNVDMTAKAISRITTIPLEIIELGIKALLEPDPDSHTPDEAGRRIIPLSPDRNWGWKIVNYLRYRELKREQDRREYHREYWHKRQAKKKETQQPQQNSSNSTEEVDRRSKRHSGNGKARGNGLKPISPDFGTEALPWSPSMLKWLEQHNDGHIPEHISHFIGYAKANGKKYADWEQALQNAIRGNWAKIRSDFPI